MPALLLTNDLMITSLATGASKAAGVELETCGSVEKLLMRSAETGARLVILDLAHPGLDPDDAVPTLKSSAGSPTVLGYGQHVHEARLEAARRAGCDRVLSRGQFCAKITELLRELGK